MAKINFQFHATHEEIAELLNVSLVSLNLYMVAIKLFPTFQCKLISRYELENNRSIIKGFKIISISSSEPRFIPNEYSKFLEENKNSLILTIGDQQEGILQESSIGSLTEDSQTLSVWKAIISGFKKRMIKGAWVINPRNGAKNFYKDHYYTPLAQKLYRDGSQITPVAGWCQYCLSPTL